MRALLLAALAALAARASAQPTPTDAWLSLSGGVALAQQAGPENDFYGSVAGHLAAPPWAVRLSYAGVDRLRYNFGGAFAGAEGAGASPEGTEPTFEPDRFDTISLGVGPAVQTDRLSGILTVGPAVTWGEDGGVGYERYVRAGLGVGGQGAVRVVGPLWAGVEAAGVWNGGASHLGAGLTLRVDLARRER